MRFDASAGKNPFIALTLSAKKELALPITQHGVRGDGEVFSRGVLTISGTEQKLNASCALPGYRATTGRREPKAMNGDFARPNLVHCIQLPRFTRTG